MDVDENDETRWVKFSHISNLQFVGKEALLLGGGCHIYFYNFNTEETLIYKANRPEKGDGVSCVAGHRSMSVFAFAEKCYKPRIIILTYPDFTKISSMNDGSEIGYLQLKFSEMEYFVSLSSLPDYSLVVWNWRTRDKLVTMPTSILTDNQFIRCSLNTPMVISQLEKVSKKLFVWDLHICYNRFLLFQHEVVLPKTANNICDMVWSSEDALYLIDSIGNIFIMEAELKKIKSIFTYDENCKEVEQKRRLLWFKSGLLISGPYFELKYYKRMNSVWQQIWNTTFDSSISALAAFNPKDIIVAFIDSGTFVTLKEDGQSVVSMDCFHDFGYKFEEISIINPLGYFFATLSNKRELMIWKVDTGEKVGQMKLETDCLTMCSNSIHPYLLLGMVDGKLEFINTFIPSNPHSFVNLFLCHEEISGIEVTDSGHTAVAATLNIGQFFIIQMQPDGMMDVLSHFKLSIDVANFVVVEEEAVLNIGILHATNTCCKSGDELHIYMYSFKNNSLSRLSTVDLDGFYVQLYPNCLKKNECLAVPHRAKHIQIMQASKSFATFKISDGLKTGHQFRKFYIQCHDEYYMTYGMDGIIFIRSCCTNNLINSLLPHHRSDFGVKKAIMDPTFQHVLSLGEDGTLLCSKIFCVNNQEKEHKLLNQFMNPLMEETFLHSQTSSSTESGGENKTWLEIQDDIKFAAEKEESAIERKAILDDFKSLQSKIVKLLNKNYTIPPEEQLPIKSFDLDIERRKRREKEALDELERTKKQLETLCVAQDKLALQIKKYTWDKMDIKRRCIKAFVSQFEVENYALFPVDHKFQNQLTLLLEHKKIMSQLIKGGYFEPWVPKTQSKLKLQLMETPRPADKNESERIREAMLEAEQGQEELEVTEEPHVFSGSSTYKYIELSPFHSSQFETSTYAQLQDEVIMLRKVQEDLRIYFNKQFNEMFAQKERELNLAVERNKRLRYILSELNDTETVVTDPTWSQEENPENIVRVADNEVQAQVYISPSRQEILDKLAAEAEARRLAELADDFRERALIEMMDGVLELLWEHKIKKDIPKPKCMLEKEPEKWDEEDMKIIRDYEEQVKFLMSERERYKKMLEAEFKTLSATVMESFQKYDSKLSDLFLLKILVQSCIDQEVLKILIARRRCHQRVLLDKKEQNIMLEMQKSERRQEEIIETIGKLQESTAECRAVYEGLVNREKNLEKYFKKDFPNASSFLIEQLYKSYKKRPKMYQRAQMSIILLNELSQYALVTEKPTYLPSECVDFLKGIDHIDLYTNAPPNVDEESWSTLCRLRRTKIECELKIKACAMELAEAEQCVSVFQKKRSAEKENYSNLHTRLKDIREEKLAHCHNMQIQIVMKKGLVEIPTTGSVSDFDDAILINRTEVENINAVILEAGKKKLDAMYEATNFRRGNICLEWEHKTMLMEIEDLKDNLRTIESIKVTKEIQAYLRNAAKGWSNDKSTFSIDKELAAVKEQYNKKMKESEKILEDFDTKIHNMMKENNKLDIKILDLNVEVNEKQLSRDLKYETEEAIDTQKILDAVMKRNRMVAQIQRQHNEIVVLQTELELLRLKTYPTLKYNTTL